MHARTLVSLALLALPLTACTPASTPASGETAAVAATPVVDVAAMRDAIQAREREWSAAYKAGDATAVGMLYTEDAMSVQAEGESQRGRAAVAASIKKGLDTINVLTRMDSTEEVIPAGDHIVEVGRLSYTGTTKVGNKPVSGSGRYMVLWRKDPDGVWRILRDISNEAPTKK